MQRLMHFQGKSADYIHLLQTITPGKGVVIVDPPRKGLEKELLNALCDNKELNNIIYVSCGWEAFKSDCLALLQAGWRLAHAEAFLFFPGSEHIEVLAVFET
jgi:tRNA/tmRNA/rRNA uracil-C5-methylase (TrmA/RlmC/RlmD family)